MSLLSTRLSAFDSSSFQEAARRKKSLAHAIDLSIGVPEELTPEHIKAAGVAAINTDKTTYTPSNGIRELRSALAAKLAKENNISLNEDAVTIVPGLTTGQLLVYMAILDPGDEIIVFEPYYPPYAHLVQLLGATPVVLSTFPTFQPNLDDLESRITTKTKAIVINSPNNPTGAVYPESTLRRIADIASKHDVLIISDEIYEHFTYETPHFSIASIYPNTLTMNGFSKEYAMTGWRVGYIAGPQHIIDAINNLQQYVVMSSSSIAQHAALRALDHRPQLLDKYRGKRRLVADRLSRIGYDVKGMDGAFFAFINCPEGEGDIEFINRAARDSLILLPGSSFSSSHNYFRLSYGANMRDLTRGLDVLDRVTVQTMSLVQ